MSTMSQLGDGVGGVGGATMNQNWPRSLQLKLSSCPVISHYRKRTDVASKRNKSNTFGFGTIGAGWLAGWPNFNHWGAPTSSRELGANYDVSGQIRHDISIDIGPRRTSTSTSKQLATFVCMIEAGGSRVERLLIHFQVSSY